MTIIRLDFSDFEEERALMVTSGISLLQSVVPADYNRKLAILLLLASF